MRIFKRFIVRSGYAHYFWDGSGRLRDLGRLSVRDLRGFMKREQVPLIDQRVIFPDPPIEEPTLPVAPYRADKDRAIVGRYQND